MPTMEVTRFRVDVDREDELVRAREAMIDDFTADRNGFLAATLVRLGDGEWLDLVLWATSADFAASREKGANRPGIGAFFETINSLVSMEEGEVVHVFDAAHARDHEEVG